MLFSDSKRAMVGEECTLQNSDLLWKLELYFRAGSGAKARATEPASLLPPAAAIVLP